MLRVKIQSLLDSRKWQGDFDNQEAADAWVAAQININAWGKPERWVRDSDEDISEALDTRMVIDSPAQEEIRDENNEIISEAVEESNHMEYKLAVQYSIAYEDITSEVEQEAINQEALKYLADTDWYVIREMDEGTPCPSEIKTERAAARARIVR